MHPSLLIRETASYLGPMIARMSSRVAEVLAIYDIVKG